MDSAVAALLADGARPRADARCNVERLVAAARAAFDERGLDVTTRDVARRAGVGLGTLHRRVPSLPALLEAILLDTVEEMTDHARRALAVPDPWRGFVDFAEVFVRLRASSCGLHAALSGVGGADRLALDARIDRLREAVRLLVLHAQDARALRDDVGWRDVVFVLATAIPADHAIGLDATADQWRRSLRIVVDGLRVDRAGCTS